MVQPTMHEHTVKENVYFDAWMISYPSNIALICMTAKNFI